MWVTLYIIAYILSYYTTRYLAREIWFEWNWGDIAANLVFSFTLIIGPIIGVIALLNDSGWKFPSPPKWLIWIGVVLLTSCSPKYYLSSGTISFSKGKPTVIRTSNKILLTDTLLTGYIITK